MNGSMGTPEATRTSTETVTETRMTSEEKFKVERAELGRRLLQENQRLEERMLRAVHRQAGGGRVLIFNSRPEQVLSTRHEGREFGFHPDLGPISIDPVVNSPDNRDEHDEGSDIFEDRIEFVLGRNPGKKESDLLSPISSVHQYRDWKNAYDISRTMAEVAIEKDARQYTSQALEYVISAQGASELTPTPTETLTPTGAITSDQPSY